MVGIGAGVGVGRATGGAALVQVVVKGDGLAIGEVGIGFATGAGAGVGAGGGATSGTVVTVGTVVGAGVGVATGIATGVGAGVECQHLHHQFDCWRSGVSRELSPQGQPDCRVIFYCKPLCRSQCGLDPQDHRLLEHCLRYLRPSYPLLWLQGRCAPAKCGF